MGQGTDLSEEYLVNRYIGNRGNFLGKITSGPYVIALFIALLLMGCSPRYTIRNQYVPAETSAFPHCSNQCEQENNQCLASCQATHQECLATAYTRSQDIYSKALVQYEAFDAAYQSQLAKWQDATQKLSRQRLTITKDLDYFSTQCNDNSTTTSYACEREQTLGRELLSLDNMETTQPTTPNRPDMAQILDKQQGFCSSNCSCAPRFDRCYSNCGGTIVPITLCVENCEEE